MKYFVHDLRIARYWAGLGFLEFTENLECDGKFLANMQNDPMFGRIILRSASAESGLESTEAKAAWLDEVGQPEFTLNAWEAVLRRLSIAQGRVLGTTTIYNTGWMKLEVYDKWKKGDPDYDVIQFDSLENPAFHQAENDRAERDMPDWKFNMMYRGQYDKPAGLIYDSFDQVACVIDRFPIPSNWLWYVGHDFGPVNPAMILYAQDPMTSLLYMVKTYQPGALPVADQVDWLKNELKDCTVILRVGGAAHEQGWRDAYAAQGWPIIAPKVKEVEVGISRVYAFPQRNGIIVFKDNKAYLDEKATYSYKLGEGYQVLDEIQNKHRYHQMDAERYIISGFPAEGVAGVSPSHRRNSDWGRSR